MTSERQNSLIGRPQKNDGLPHGEISFPLLVRHYIPAQVVRRCFAHGRRYLREVRRYVMLEAVGANEVQELLHVRNPYYAGPAESLQWIVGEFAFAHVAADLARRMSNLVLAENCIRANGCQSQQG